ncbi:MULTISPECIES: SDR family NAD(P)-dependent oxidoreductase [Actinomadura]|uniref:NAD(P)-dependent dehydrogenase, short-chain alcohol dehydrogenase family n=1 Tax=Actinomadura madurae TaxID=1993 RepID=A0A1I5XAC8_9ACTN|nr:SDR family NAD(P)-dependent oxidoreductase [Actinomadura madurae]SFQ28933.1 NAD(P)-dependent dehydrogenase, short-chain alcohol dehydrogenase family [Actinomadura madurae]
MPEMLFDGRVAIVTGAGGDPGLGRSYALMLASRGARVVVNDVGSGVKGASDNASADTVVDEIRAAGGRAVADTHSVADPDGARAIVQTAVDAFGGVDILVNNAGVCIYAEADEMSDAHMRLTMDVNLMGTLWMCRAVWPHMRETGYGRIVNTTSAAAKGIEKLSAYGAAKAGVIGLTRSLSIEASRHGDVKVNAIGPGAGTRMVAVAMREGSDAATAAMRNSPDRVAPTVAYLAHEDCRLNGEVLQSAFGRVSRLVLKESPRVEDLGERPEDVRDHLDEVMDLTEAELVPQTGEAFAAMAQAAKPYTA